MKIVGAVLLILVLMFGLTWVVEGNDFFLYKYFGPRREQVRRQVFEQTRSFNQGMIQELENMQRDYIKTPDKDAKAALASIILHRASGYNLDDPDVPESLRTFIAKLKESQ
jgi:hypothetical protein